MPLDDLPEHYSANLRTDRRLFVAPRVGFEPTNEYVNSVLSMPKGSTGIGGFLRTY